MCGSRANSRAALATAGGRKGGGVGCGACKSNGVSYVAGGTAVPPPRASSAAVHRGRRIAGRAAGAAGSFGAAEDKAGRSGVEVAALSATGEGSEPQRGNKNHNRMQQDNMHKRAPSRYQCEGPAVGGVARATPGAAMPYAEVASLKRGKRGQSRAPCIATKAVVCCKHHKRGSSCRSRKDTLLLLPSLSPLQVQWRVVLQRLREQLLEQAFDDRGVALEGRHL